MLCSEIAINSPDNYGSASAVCDGTKLSGLTYTRKIEVVRQGFFFSSNEHF